MNATAQDQLHTLSKTSSVPPPADTTPRLSNLGIDSWVVSQKLLPDGTIVTENDKLREFTRATQLGIGSQLFSDGPGLDAPYIRNFPPGWKHNFHFGSRNANGRRVTKSCAAMIGNIDVSRLIDGDHGALFSFGRQTEIRLRTSNAETDPGGQSNLQAPVPHEVFKLEETSDETTREGQDTSATSSNVWVKEEDEKVKEEDE